MDGRARVSKQTTSCIRIHTSDPSTLIAAQHGCLACMRYYVETTQNAGIAPFFPDILKAACNRRFAQHMVHAAIAARMNTYAVHASNRNRRLKLHHANKLLPLGSRGGVRLARISHGRHSRESGNPSLLFASEQMDSRFRGNDGHHEQAKCTRLHSLHR